MTRIDEALAKSTIPTAQSRQSETESREIDRKAAMARLWASRGCRYKDCLFQNYTVSTPEQGQVVARLREYAENMAAEVEAGRNVVLIGPPGTGKDHLLAAMMRQAINVYQSVLWTSGARLFARLRDDIESGAIESATIREYREPSVLCISDPAWDSQPLTRQQRLKLGEIVDERYNRRKAIWISINATGREDAIRLLGAAIVDRLRDDAVSEACNWASHRGPRPRKTS